MSEKAFGAHPWWRFFARAFDTVFLLWPCSFLFNAITTICNIEVLNPQSTTWWMWCIIVVFYFACHYLAEAACLFYFHATPGKKLFGISVHAQPGMEEALARYIARTWQVFFKGYALMIPIVSLFTFSPPGTPKRS